MQTRVDMREYTTLPSASEVLEILIIVADLRISEYMNDNKTC